MNRKYLCFFCFGAMLMGRLPAPAREAAPTEEREWRSTAGTSILAVATRMKPDVVQLKTLDGDLIAVPLNKFVPEDRTFLIRHFGFEGVVPEPGKAQRSPVEIVKNGLAHPPGTIQGLIDAGGGSHYYLYVPTTLREGRKAPLLLFTGAGGGNTGSIRNHVEGAEINGWIVAASVESRNGKDRRETNHGHAKRCVEHLVSTLPVDAERVYFTGNSGGGAMAFYNAARIPSAGAMPLIGYDPKKENDMPGDFFIITGATDYNRCASANAAAQFDEAAIHRFHPGGHSSGPNWILHDGMAWLNGRFLAKKPGLAEERLDYEASMIGWIRKLQVSEPHRAHYWCRFLRKDYRIAGHNGQVVADLFAKLDSEPGNRKYSEGIDALDTFSDEYYSDVSAYSKQKHTTPEIRKAANRLAEQYIGVPHIGEVARKLGEPTG